MSKCLTFHNKQQYNQAGAVLMPLGMFVLIHSKSVIEDVLLWYEMFAFANKIVEIQSRVL